VRHMQKRGFLESLALPVKERAPLLKGLVTRVTFWGSRKIQSLLYVHEQQVFNC
jgi:hypothetical protein